MKPLKHAALLLFLLATTFVVRSQEYGFDKKLSQAVLDLQKYPRPDTARVNALITLFNKAVYLKERKLVAPYCDEALSLSKKLNYPIGLAECYLQKGLLAKSSLDRPKAHLYFDSAIAVNGDPQDKDLQEPRALANRWKGMIYYEQENYYNALPYLFEALSFFESNPTRTTTQLCSFIATIYRELNNPSKAEEYAKKTISYAEKYTDTMTMVQSYMHYVDICMDKKDFALAESYLDKASPHIPDSIQIMINNGYYQRRGDLCVEQKKYTQAYQYYQLSLKQAQLSGHEVNIVAAYSDLSRTALLLGNRDEAKHYATLGLEMAERNDSRSDKVWALLSLSEYQNSIGNFSEAYQLLRKAVTLNDSVVSETNLKQANTLAAMYDADQRQKQIGQLQIEKEKQTASVRQKSMLNWVFAIAIVVLLILGILLYRNYKNRHQLLEQQQELQKQKIRELEKDKQLLTVTSMLRGQEEERSRIAKDLHDGLGGMLSGVKLAFMNTRDKLEEGSSEKNSFQQPILMLDKTIAELRKVAHNLMPEILLRFGLEEAVKDFCNGIQVSSGIEVVYQQFGTKRKIDDGAAIAAYRIIQELVNNALKYAEATQIMVQLTMHPDKLTITVEDNGKGFDPAIIETKKGAGFVNIRHRVDYFKGNIDIASEPGNGSSVTIELIA